MQFGVVVPMSTTVPTPRRRSTRSSCVAKNAEKRGFAKVFDCFCTLQETAFADMARHAAQLDTAAGTRPALAMEMAVRANASKTLAEKLIAPDTQM